MCLQRPRGGRREGDDQGQAGRYQDARRSDAPAARGSHPARALRLRPEARPDDAPRQVHRRAAHRDQPGAHKPPRPEQEQPTERVEPLLRCWHEGREVADRDRARVAGAEGQASLVTAGNISSSSHDYTVRLTKRDAPISANAREHWSRERDEHRELRWDAKILTLALGLRGKVEAIHLRLLVYPPDHRRRDEDNLIPH